MISVLKTVRMPKVGDYMKLPGWGNYYKVTRIRADNECFYLLVNAHDESSYLFENFPFEKVMYKDT